MGWRRDEKRGPYEQLTVWRLGLRLARQIYRMTRKFPDDEKYELVAQLRSAAISVPSNIAEGSARRTTSDYLRFLYQARGSLVEIDTQVRLAADFGYLDNQEAEETRETFDNLARGLQGLIDALEEKR